MKSSDLSTKLYEKLFKLKVIHLSSEQGVSAATVKAFMVVNLIIVLDAVYSKIHLLNLMHLQFERSITVVLVVTSVLTVTKVITLVASLLLSSQTKIHEKLPRFIDWSAKSSLIADRLVLPLHLWSLTHVIFSSDKMIALALGLPSAIIGIAGFQVSSLLLKSTFPSFAFLTPLSVVRYSILCVTTFAVPVIGVIGKRTNSHTLQIAASMVNSALIVSLTILVLLKPLFWNSSANKTFICFYLILTCISLWNTVATFMTGFTAKWSILALAPIFASKVSQIVQEFQDNQDLFSTKDELYKLRGLYLMVELFNKSWSERLDNCERLRLERYLFQIVKHGARLGLSEEDSLRATKTCGALGLFLADLGEGYPKSELMAKFELLARLMSPSDNIVKAFGCLLKFKRNAGHSLVSCLETRLYEMVFEARMQAFYYLRPEEKASQETIVSQLFNNYIINAEQNINTRVADICLPLNLKVLFLKMNSIMQENVVKRLDIYNYIVNRASSNLDLRLSDLFASNSRDRTKTLEVRRMLDEEVKQIRIAPSYYYPPQFVLQAMLFHDTVNAKKVMREFRKSLLHWEIIKAREQSLKLDVLDFQAAVLQVSLQNQDKGKIVDATPNWPDMLGEIENDASITTMNVNDFFINLLAKKHAIMMNNTSGLTKLLNTKRDFYIKTFCGELKSVIFTLRLWPSLEKDLTGVVAIGPSATQRQGQNMVLLHQNMDVIEAEDGFWANLGLNEENTDLKSVLQITKKFLTVNKLLEVYSRFLEDTQKFDVDAEHSTPLEAIYKIGKAIVRLNNNCNLIYRVDEDSQFYKRFKGVPLVGRLDISTFLDLKLTQLFLRFGTKDQENISSLYPRSTTNFSNDQVEDTNNLATNHATTEVFDLAQYYDPLKSMTLQEKIKMWNEEEKPTEIDALLTELNIWVGKADSQEVRLCPLVLKNYLVEFGEIFASYKIAQGDQSPTRSVHTGGSQNENPEIPYQIEQFKPDSSEKVICFVIPQKEDTRLDASSGKMVPENLPRQEDIRISLLDDRSLAKHPEDKKKSATVKSDIKVILVGNDDDENRVAGRHRKTKTTKEDMRINHNDNLAKRKRNRKQTDQQEHTYEKKKTPMQTVRSTSKSSFRKRVGDA